MNSLHLEALRYAYPGRGTVVNNVSLHIAPGEFHCLIGRSGCGKTTLLKLAAGLQTPDQGRVLLNGRPITKPASEMGFVFQSPTLLDWLSVVDNILLPLSLHRKVTVADQHQAEQLLVQMGLAALGHVKPQHLSGGQQSRVAIARALITRPTVLFMDEPFASLDAMTREELQKDFLALCHAQGTSVLFVTHDIAEAVYLADQVSIMHQGEIYAQRSLELSRPREPAIRYTPSFNTLCAALRDAMDATP